MWLLDCARSDKLNLCSVCHADEVSISLSFVSVVWLLDCARNDKLNLFSVCHTDEVSISLSFVSVVWLLDCARSDKLNLCSFCHADEGSISLSIILLVLFDSSTALNETKFVTNNIKAFCVFHSIVYLIQTSIGRL